jgi:hypothetical protein
MVSDVTFTLAAAILVYAVLDYYLRLRQDVREPPVLPSNIPFISRIPGMVSKKAKFFVGLR